MIVLDTNYLSFLQRPESAECVRLVDAMNQSIDRVFATTVISLEEQMRGWLAAIRRVQLLDKQIVYYERLLTVAQFFSGWQVLPFDQRAAQRLLELRKLRIRVGMMDLKIAAIVLVHDALLVSANLRDFRQVPGLEVEDWLAA